MSDFSELLHTVQLSQHDTDSVLAEINRHEQAIRGIDARIAELTKAFVALNTEKRTHHAAVSRCKGILTLARRLPPDVLADMFEWCTTMDWTMAPIVLSRVCSAWFKASRIPRVWTMLYIDCEASDVLERTRFWLAMAQSAPFDIRLRASWPPVILDKILDMLIPRAQQWRSISLDTANLETVDHIMTRLPVAGEMRRLSTLDLVTQGASFGMPDEMDLSRLAVAFTGVNNLRTLRLTCNTLRPITQLPQTIETLEITVNAISITLPAFILPLRPIIGGLALLKHLSLRVAALQFENDQWRQGSPVERLPIDTLETLSLCMPPDFNALLDVITCPNLRKLSMKSSSSESVSIIHPATGAALVAFLASTNVPPPIRCLELYDLDIPDPAFEAALPLLVELEELRLHWSDISDSVMRQLSAETSLCPSLRRLDLRWCLRLHGRVLVDVVRSRKEPGSGLSNTAVSAIEEVAVLNCAYVEERDVFDLAATTVCRLSLRPYGDPCRESHQRQPSPCKLQTECMERQRNPGLLQQWPLSATPSPQKWQ